MTIEEKIKLLAKFIQELADNVNVTEWEPEEGNYTSTGYRFSLEDSDLLERIIKEN